MTEPKFVTFAVPAEIVHAAEKAAQEDLTTVSYICRRALLDALRERGLVPKSA
jgi:hypothetical protein